METTGGSCGLERREGRDGIRLERRWCVASALLFQGLGTGGTAMKKATLAFTTLAALTVTAVVRAQEPTTGGPTPTLPEASPQAVPPLPTTPIVPVPQSGPCPQTSTTTITSADATAARPAMPPPTRETITVRQEHRPNRPLLYTGGATLVGSYAATVGMAIAQNIRDANGNQPLFIPIAGPWMHLANSTETPLNRALIAGSGVVQSAGIVLGALAFIVPEHIPAATIQAGGVKVNFTAASYGRGSAGIGAFGQF
jgi:hypothetical protein